MELTQSYKAIKGSVLRTIVFTLGHFVIAAAVISLVTGVAFSVAITASIIEPLVNGLWYFVLDRLWTKFSK